MDIKKVQIQRCNYRCGYSFIDIHSHMWQHHPELVDPNTGTVSYMADSIAEVQETMTNSLDSNQQAVSDQTDTRVDQPEKGDICRSNMNSKPRSNQQEVPHTAESRQQEVPDPADARAVQATQDESYRTGTGLGSNQQEVHD